MLSGHDGLVRGARVRVRSRNGSILLNRPLQLLYPYEVTLTDFHGEAMATESNKVERQQEPDAVRRKHLPEGRPKRIASAIARERIKMLADQTSD